MIESIGHATADSESLTQEEFRIERLALLLRTTRGAPLTGLDEAKVAQLIEEGLSRKSDEHLVLTRKGSALVDAIVSP